MGNELDTLEKSIDQKIAAMQTAYDSRQKARDSGLVEDEKKYDGSIEALRREVQRLNEIKENLKSEELRAEVERLKQIPSEEAVQKLKLLHLE